MMKSNEAGPPPTYSATANETSQFSNEPPPKYESAPQGSTIYPQQQQGYGYQTQPVLVMNQPLSFSSIPARITCQYCHADVTTSIEYEAGALTWLTSGVLCIVGCWLGCCLVPFCIKDLQDVKHTCPNCNHLVGINRRM